MILWILDAIVAFIVWIMGIIASCPAQHGRYRDISPLLCRIFSLEGLCRIGNRLPVMKVGNAGNIRKPYKS